MCFSAGASFGASALIGTIGVSAFKKASTPSQKNFSLLPIFFALQQFTEGVVWLGLSGTIDEEWLPIFIPGFLIFAWVVWPTFIPFSINRLESDKKKKKILRGMTWLGAIVSLTLIYVMIFENVNARITEDHIRYSASITHPFRWVFDVIYVMVIILPLFISSVNKMWYLGAINLGSYIYSKLVFNDYVVSVWCFFAAISSIVVLVIIYEMQKETEHKVPRPT